LKFLESLVIAKVDRLWIAAKTPALKSLKVSNVSKWVVDGPLVASSVLETLDIRSVVLVMQELLNIDSKNSIYNKKGGIIVQSNKINSIKLSEIKFEYFICNDYDDYNRNRKEYLMKMNFKNIWFLMMFNKMKIGSLFIEGPTNNLEISLDNVNINYLTVIGVKDLFIDGKVSLKKDDTSLYLIDVNSLKWPDMKSIDYALIMGSEVITGSYGDFAIKFLRGNVIPDCTLYLDLNELFEILIAHGITKKTICAIEENAKFMSFSELYSSIVNIFSDIVDMKYILDRLKRSIAYKFTESFLGMNYADKHLNQIFSRIDILTNLQRLYLKELKYINASSFNSAIECCAKLNECIVGVFVGVDGFRLNAPNLCIKLNVIAPFVDLSRLNRVIVASMQINFLGCGYTDLKSLSKIHKKEQCIFISNETGDIDVLRCGGIYRHFLLKNSSVDWFGKKLSLSSYYGGLKFDGIYPRMYFKEINLTGVISSNPNIVQGLGNVGILYCEVINEELRDMLRLERMKKIR
jgi:hypothetical protein